MAHSSPTARKLRRLKRERTLAYKGLDLALSQRDQARMVATALEGELKQRDTPSLTIEKVEEPAVE